MKKAMTLIEVLAALVILGVVLAALVMAGARHTRQRARAARLAVAVEAADGLLERLWSETDSALYAGGGEGELAAQGLAWRIRTRPNAEVEALGGRVLLLEIFDNAPVGALSFQADEALATVEIVLPAEEATEDDEAS